MGEGRTGGRDERKARGRAEGCWAHSTRKEAAENLGGASDMSQASAGNFKSTTWITFLEYFSHAFG